jgi:hypothetical protein
MNSAAHARLLKVLALADSSYDGEAVAAVRMARQLLAQEGLNFQSLAAPSQQATARPLQAPTAALQTLEAQLAETRQQLLAAQRTSQERATALAAVNQRVHNLEQTVNRAQVEVEKWRNLARETANKLWDIGQQIAEDRTVTATPLPSMAAAHETPLRGATPSRILSVAAAASFVTACWRRKKPLMPNRPANPNF